MDIWLVEFISKGGRKLGTESAIASERAAAVDLARWQHEKRTGKRLPRTARALVCKLLFPPQEGVNDA